MQRSADHSLQIALHESRHASFASYKGLLVLGVHVARFEGHTDVQIPMSARDLQRRWDTDPIATTEDMRAIAGTLTAPVSSVGRLFRGPTDDSAELGTYGRAWIRLRPSQATGQRPPAWLDLLGATRSEVRTWATRPGALMSIYTIAAWLAREGDLDSSAWSWLWAQPFSRPLHQPRPAPPAAAPVRRAPAVSVQQTAAQRDLQNLIAFYDMPRTATAPAPARSTTYAQEHRPNGRFEYFQPRFLRVA